MSRRSHKLKIHPILRLELLEDRRVPAVVASYGFDEGSGSALGDSSGNGLSGTISGATWTNAGKYGSALSFDGASDLVTIPDANLLDLTTAMTLEAWVKPTAAATDWSVVLLKERPNGLAYGLYATDGANKPPAGYINRNGTDQKAAAATTLPLNTWSHLAVTYDAAVLRLYVNGIQVASKNQTGAITTSTGALRIGGDTVWGEWFTGLIDEVRLYNQALSQTEIQTDSSTSVASRPQLSVEAAIPGETAPVLTPAELNPLVGEAIRRWEASGLSAKDVAAIQNTRFQIADLASTGALGLAPIGGSLIQIDDNGGGRGWFIDSTPTEDSEFPLAVAPTEFRASGGSAAGGYDLLTVVMHELGHIIGRDDLDPAIAGHDLLTATLPLGTRRTLTNPTTALPGEQSEHQVPAMHSVSLSRELPLQVQEIASPGVSVTPSLVDSSRSSRLLPEAENQLPLVRLENPSVGGTSEPRHSRVAPTVAIPLPQILDHRFPFKRVDPLVQWEEQLEFGVADFRSDIGMRSLLPKSSTVLDFEA